MKNNTFEGFTSSLTNSRAEILMQLYENFEKEIARNNSPCIFFTLDFSKYPKLSLDDINEQDYLILDCRLSENQKVYQLILLKVNLLKVNSKLTIRLPKKENPGKWILKNGKGTRRMIKTIKEQTGKKISYIYITN